VLAYREKCSKVKQRVDEYYSESVVGATVNLSQERPNKINGGRKMVEE
jgi:hypothetical protein